MLLGKKEIKKEIQTLTDKQERMLWTQLTETRELESLKVQVQNNQELAEEEKHETGKKLNVVSEIQEQHGEALQELRDAKAVYEKDLKENIEKQNEQKKVIEMLSGYQAEHTDWLNALQKTVEFLQNEKVKTEEKNAVQEKTLQEYSDWLLALQEGIERLGKEEQNISRQNEKYEKSLQDHSDWLLSLQEGIERIGEKENDISNHNLTYEKTLQEHTEWLTSLQKVVDYEKEEDQLIQKKVFGQEKNLQEHTEWLESLQNILDFVKVQQQKDQKKLSEQEASLQSHTKWLSSLQNSIDFSLNEVKDIREKYVMQEKALQAHTEWLNAIQSVQEFLKKENESIRKMNREHEETLRVQNKWMEALQSEVEKFNRFIEKINQREIEKSEIAERIYNYQIDELRQKKKAILVSTAEHDNIGDSAITLAEQKWLLEKLPDYYQIEFSTYKMKEQYAFLHTVLHPEDIFFIQGGGNIGNCYLEEEEMHRRIIADFPNHKIVILPQSIYFDDTEEGKLELEKSKEIYNKHKNLTLCVRGKANDAFAKKHFSSLKIKIVPDMVYALKAEYSFKRSGVLAVLRDDKEKILSEKQKENMVCLLEKEFEYTEYTNNTSDQAITRDKRRLVVKTELNRYAKHELVVTDRLHGMLFSVITGTPCIVLNSGNGKIEDYYETFLKESNAVFYLGDQYDKLKETIQTAMKVEKVWYPDLNKQLNDSLNDILE